MAVFKLDHDQEIHLVLSACPASLREAPPLRSWRPRVRSEVLVGFTQKRGGRKEDESHAKAQRKPFLSLRSLRPCVRSLFAPPRAIVPAFSAISAPPPPFRASASPRDPG